MIDFDDHGHLFEESVVSSDPMTWAMLASDAENQAADAGWDFHKTGFGATHAIHLKSISAAPPRRREPHGASFAASSESERLARAVLGVTINKGC